MAAEDVVVKRLLGSVAFEMATRNHWRYVPGSGRSLAGEIEDVLKCAKERFVRSKVPFQEIEPGQVWTWAVKIIDHFMSYGGALGAQKGDRVLSFTTRRIQEMRAALFMTQYAAPLELRNEKHWLSSARGPQFVRSLWVSTGIENVVQACPMRAIS